MELQNLKVGPGLSMSLNPAITQFPPVFPPVALRSEHLAEG